MSRGCLSIKKSSQVKGLIPSFGDMLTLLDILIPCTITLDSTFPMVDLWLIGVARRAKDKFVIGKSSQHYHDLNFGNVAMGVFFYLGKRLLSSAPQFLGTVALQPSIPLGL